MVEVSRNVVAILLVLVIAVSGFGTYSLVTRDSYAPSSGEFAAAPPGSEVTLQIGDRAGVDGTLQLSVTGGQ